MPATASANGRKESSEPLSRGDVDRRRGITSIPGTQAGQAQRNHRAPTTTSKRLCRKATMAPDIAPTPMKEIATVVRVDGQAHPQYVEQAAGERAGAKADAECQQRQLCPRGLPADHANFDPVWPNGLARRPRSLSAANAAIRTHISKPPRLGPRASRSSHQGASQK